MEFAASEDDKPPRGATVALHGLAKQAQHNGATGIVTDEINEKDGRLGVRIAYGEKARTLRVKPGNLRRVEACASFDERGVAPCRVLSPKLMKEIAASFREKRPWALPRAAETIVRAQLLREDATIEEGYVSVSNSDPPAWAASQEEIAKRAKQAQDAGLEAMATLRDELDGAACAKGLRFTHSFEHHARLLYEGRPREALALLVGVGDLGRRDSPASVCRCYRAEEPSDSEMALLAGCLEHVPRFLASLKGLPESFAVPLSYDAKETTHELRKELRITLAEEPGDARPIYLRLTYPALPDMPSLENVKRARIVVEKQLPAGSTVAPRFGSKTAYATVKDAERYHRIQSTQLTGRTRAGHELALALALASYRREPEHREAMALCRRAVHGARGADVGERAEELLEELCAATGDDAQTFLGEGLGVRPVGPRPPRNLERGAAERELERRTRAQRNLHLGA
ncbi:unnamed protein product [Pelagomonas calceolata]|uniref:Uncharacterized protein n=1 Tax=Pelagomonas calceolata TaxID=35677 RepID=A0A7S4A7Y2_9STRA|nr:unnamed protein product [Pelagomonas calceolata]